LYTPLAIESIRAAWGVYADDLRRSREALVPLRQTMGTGWDVANAVLYLASDEAGFFTAAVLPVDGGQQGRVG
jgi:NAD(P)-dependent dehydrogenase (short-subunit alcohol dehydrogenase family)